MDYLVVATDAYISELRIIRDSKRKSGELDTPPRFDDIIEATNKVLKTNPNTITNFNIYNNKVVIAVVSDCLVFFWIDEDNKRVTLAMISNDRTLKMIYMSILNM